MPPNPSTVPMRVRELMVGPGTPFCSKNLVCSTFGKFSGHVSSGTSRMGVPKVADRCSSHARMAGHRFFVRGEA